MTIALDAWFNARVGLLSRPPEYDGVSYMVSAQGIAHLLQSLHLRTGLHAIGTSIAPLWIGALAFQFLVAGAGPVQAFAARFWAVALLLVLVYWIVRSRAPRSLAIAAVVLTALLPIVVAGVRSSSWEFFVGPVSYDTDFGLDDARPDFLAAVLALWSIASLVEQTRGLRRSAYLVSVAFAASAVLVKQSTSPLVLAVWGVALAAVWFVHRRERLATRWTVLAVALLAVLLSPWAIYEGGARSVVRYLYQTEVTYKGAYGTNEGVLQRLGYFLGQLPSQLGQVEVWIVVAGAVLLAVALARRQLALAETVYAAVTLLFYVAFSLPTSRNPHLGIWISTSLWVFFWAGASRAAVATWPGPMTRASPALLAAAGVYTLLVYALGGIAVAGWPADEQRANQQRLEVTAGVAHELSRHISGGQCFTYAPGPGWPASIEFLMMDANGNAPASTATEVDTNVTTIGEYVDSARKCDAFLVYQQAMATVAQAFYAPPVYQPYFQAVADWVRAPASGYTLDRTWSFSDLPPLGQHALGRYQGVSLNVELYLRSSGT